MEVVLLGLLSEELLELEESIELELEVLTELGVSSLLELEESRELELVENSTLLVLASIDLLLLEESLSSVELLLLEESRELLELEMLESDNDVKLESEIELDELPEESPPIDSLESLEELNSTDGSKMGMDAQVIIALVIGYPKVIVINPLPEPVKAFLPVKGKLSDLLRSYLLIILSAFCLLEYL